MKDQRNVILAVVLSTCILLGYQWLFAGKDAAKQAQQAAQQATTSSTGAPAAPSNLSAGSIGAPTGTPVDVVQDRSVILNKTQRVFIKNENLVGSIDLKGARFDDITLSQYKETIEEDSPNVSLLSPEGTAKPYFAEFGWSVADSAIKVPGPDSQWTASSSELTPSTPVELRWDNGQGITFVRIISVDDKYVFTINQRVENKSNQPLTLYPYGLVARVGLPKLQGYAVLHEGPLGVLDGTLKEESYDSLKDETHQFDSTGGWVGITDKYWLTALLFDQKTPVHAKFFARNVGGRDRYQVDYLGNAVTVGAGQSQEITNRIFIGAKEIYTITGYEEKYGIEKFDLSIDFGWFYFLTKPFFFILDYLYGIFGNFGLAILGFVFLLRLVMFPLANKSYRSMNAMKRVQPEIKKLQERYANDKTRQQQEMMALYKREKANPMSGCLPMLIQIPVFFALYKVLFISIEMRHAPFYGWIKDLSAPDPTNVFTAFGLIPWTPPEMLHLGIWPILMGLSMWLLQKMSPAPADPTQAKIMMFLPVMFTFMLGRFAAGLVIYWALSNVLSIAQQYALLKLDNSKREAAEAEKAAAKAAARTGKDKN